MWNELTNEQVRQLIDVEQAFEVQRKAENELQRRYEGSMNWKRRNGTDYLYRSAHGVWRSLGPRTVATERTYQAFRAGKEEQKTRLKSIRSRLKEMASVNKALRLGRVPLTAARVLRRLDKVGLLDHNIRVVGTNVLFAYEAAAGVQLQAGIVATTDIDLLFDARRQLRLAVIDQKPEALVAILRTADRSFELQRVGGFRVANRHGYMVDLIAPTSSDPVRRGHRTRSVGDPDRDLVAAEIAGLIWLESTPAFERTVVGEDGLPARLVCIDPRVFAAHKMWLASEAEGRDPRQRQRDKAQAEVVVQLVKERLPQLTLDDPALSALPAKLRAALI